MVVHPQLGALSSVILPVIWIIWDAPPKKPRDTFSGEAVYQRVGNSNLSKI